MNKKIKVVVTMCEYYPFFELIPGKEYFDKYGEIISIDTETELDEEEWKEYQKLMTLFNKWQKKMDKIIHQGKKV